MSHARFAFASSIAQAKATAAALDGHLNVLNDAISPAAIASSMLASKYHKHTRSPRRATRVSVECRIWGSTKVKSMLVVLECKR